MITVLYVSWKARTGNNRQGEHCGIVGTVSGKVDGGGVLKWNKYVQGVPKT